MIRVPTDRAQSRRRPSEEDAPLLSVPDVAEHLGVSVRTVRAWIAAGRLAVVRLGPRCVRIEPAEVRRLVEEARR
ncbi:MAG: helix-turn-helix domain-containing protein [Planctomycetota bacterium]